MVLKLDGREFEYVYTDASKVVLTFENERLKYRWLAGPFEGVEESDLEYDVREIENGIYIVNWHDKNNNNFVTLVISTESKKLYSSAILGYGSDDAITLFDEAHIERAK